MTELKTQKNDADVDDFLNSIGDANKQADSIELRKLFESVTGEPARMWGDSIVGFGEYHYKYASGREGDWMATGFSPRKQNLTIYIMAGFENLDAELKEIGKHTRSVSCLYIKRLEDINLSVLERLVKKSIVQLDKMYSKN